MPILNMVSWGCLLKASSNSVISGRGVVEIWKASILGGLVFVGSCGGVSGMVLLEDLVHLEEGPVVEAGVD